MVICGAQGAKVVSLFLLTVGGVFLNQVDGCQGEGSGNLWMLLVWKGGGSSRREESCYALAAGAPLF